MAAEIKALVEVLATGGPYAVIVFLGLAYWSQQKYIRDLHQKLIDMSTSQVQAMGALKTSVDGLKDTMAALNARL